MGRVEKNQTEENMELKSAHETMAEIAGKMADLADRAEAFSKGEVGEFRIRRALLGISQRFRDYRKTVVAEMNTMKSRYPLRLIVVLILSCTFMSGCGSTENPAQSQELVEVYKTDSPNMIHKAVYKEN